jgi:hypothetical protein
MAAKARKIEIVPGYEATQSRLISDEEYERLFGGKDGPLGPLNPNPCVNLYGPGPAGAVCGDCQHLIRYHQSARWNKCEFRRGARGGEGGPATDHRVRWQACARFVVVPEKDK